MFRLACTLLQVQVQRPERQGLRGRCRVTVGEVEGPRCLRAVAKGRAKVPRVAYHFDGANNVYCGDVYCVLSYIFWFLN